MQALADRPDLRQLHYIIIVESDWYKSSIFSHSATFNPTPGVSSGRQALIKPKRGGLQTIIYGSVEGS